MGRKRREQAFPKLDPREELLLEAKVLLNSALGARMVGNVKLYCRGALEKLEELQRLNKEKE